MLLISSLSSGKQKLVKVAIEACKIRLEWGGRKVIKEKPFRGDKLVN